MRIITEKQVSELLTPRACIDVMREALINIENGTSSQYLRTAIPMRPGKIFAFMPSYYNDQFFGAKIISVFPGNSGTEFPSHMGQVLLFGSEHGEMRGMVDGTAITRIRTGAVSAVATDILARKGATSLALLGAGAQARSHYAAIKCIRNITKVYIYDIERKYAEALAAEIKIGASCEGVPAPEVIVCDTPGEATRDADIICTLTHSSEPLINLADVKPGAHINAVGACAAKDRELSSDLVAASRFYGDNYEAVFAESGDMLYAISDGSVGSDHYLGNIASVILGDLEGRTSEDEITIFEALGLATEDIAAAVYCYTETEKREEACEDVGAAEVVAEVAGVGVGTGDDGMTVEATDAETAEVDASQAAEDVGATIMEASDDATTVRVVGIEAADTKVADIENVDAMIEDADVITETPAFPENISPARVAEFHKLESELQDISACLDNADAEHGRVLTELKAVATQITDINMENGMLQNKLLGRKQAKSKIADNEVVLERLTAKMDALKEQKEAIEIEQRRLYRTAKKIREDITALQ